MEQFRDLLTHPSFPIVFRVLKQRGEKIANIGMKTNVTIEDVRARYDEISKITIDWQKLRKQADKKVL